MICTDCPQRDVCDLAGKDDPLLTGCDASHGTWAFDRLRLDRMTADRDALRAEVEALRHEVELTNEHEHQILTERNEARAELERTKEDLERVRRNHLRRMHREALDWADRMIWDTPDEWVMRNRPRLLDLASRIRAALERKDGASHGS